MCPTCGIFFSSFFLLATSVCHVAFTPGRCHRTGEVTYTWGIWGGRGYSTHDAANNDDSGDDYAQQQDCTDAMGSLNYKLGTTTFNCASPRTTDTSMCVP